MRVWLINPPVLRRRPSSISAVIQGMFYNSPPLGLCYLAAVLEADGHRVFISDCPVEQMTVDDLAPLGRELRPELIGVTMATPFFDTALETARSLRAALPGVPIVAGGPHYNADPELLLRHDEFDLAVQGEGERTLAEVARALEGGTAVEEVPGVVVKRDGALHAAPPRPLVDDLSELPFPARHLIPMERYRPLPNDEHRLPKTAVITSRGCPYKCIFCAKQTFGPRHRTNAPRRVMEELHYLVDRWGVRDVAFVDSLFTPSAARVDAMMDAFEADHPGVSWSCSCRADVLDERLLRRMKDAGCWKIRIAIESGNDHIREVIKKGLSKEQFAAVVEAADRVGLQVKAFFMVGHIGDTVETIRESIDFALSIPLSDVTVQINTPLMGTPQYEMCPDHGEFITGDTSQYSFFEPVFVPRGMTAGQLEALHREFYRRFYLRPSLIRRRARHIHSLRDIAPYVRAIPLAANVMFGAGSE